MSAEKIRACLVKTVIARNEETKQSSYWDCFALLAMTEEILKQVQDDNGLW